MICSTRCPYYTKGMCFKKQIVKIVKAGADCKVELEKERREWEKVINDKET